MTWHIFFKSNNNLKVIFSSKLGYSCPSCSLILDCALTFQTQKFASENFLKVTVCTMIPKFLLLLLLSQCILADDCRWVRIILRGMGGNVSMIPTDCCQWNRILCVDGHVTGIDWSDLGLTGIISRDIARLTHLQEM